MREDLYDKLADALKRKGGGIPAVKCKEFRAVADELFTEDEAEMAIMMPDMLVSADMLAAKTKLDAKKVAGLLDRMTRKGLLFSINRHNTHLYSLLAFVPGIFENQFNAGPVDTRSQEAGKDIGQLSYGNKQNVRFNARNFSRRSVCQGHRYQ